MSEVRMVIRDAERSIHANRHGSVAQRVIATLSAEPESIGELDGALERFMAPDDGGFFRGFRPGDDDTPYDAGLVIVDLAARLVVCDSTYALATRDGSVSYHNGKCATNVDIRYHLSDDWQLGSDALAWCPLADERRRRRLAEGPLDARSVLYGNALLEFIARECLKAFAKAPNANEADDDGALTRVREIHARWLTAPRDDLRGQAPRDVLLARQHFINRDLQDRANQWSFQGQCPPGLERESAAFRYAGFGTHELVMYYYMVRALIWSCRDSLLERPAAAGPHGLTAGDFLTCEVPRLARSRDEWLDEPDPEFHGRTPRGIIDRERARLPEGITGKEAVIDHDCPLCAMQADMPGPMFWHLDGCNMDDEFAFSFHRTRAEWDEEQREHEEFSRRFDAKWAERERLGVEYPGGGYADPDCAWDRSFSATSAGADSVFIRLFSIGSHLADLIAELKEPYRDGELPAEQRGLIDQLSRDFGNLREVAQSSDIAMMAALFDPVLDRFCESLATVGAAQGELDAKCSDLQDRLRRFLEPPPETSDSLDTEDDDELPF